jgi:succinate dehydrogenase/fumarate reductase cytochrome b subunit
MDISGAILLVWFLGSAVLLAVIEALAGPLHVPTISERIQSIDRSARIVGVVVCVAAGILLNHFFG